MSNVPWSFSSSRPDMNARDAIKSSIDTAQMCCNMYLDDMTG